MPYILLNLLVLSLIYVNYAFQIRIGISWSHVVTHKRYALMVSTSSGKNIIIRSNNHKCTNYRKTSNQVTNNGNNNNKNNRRGFDNAWEHGVRKAIHRGNWLAAESLIKQLNSTELSSGRNAVYVITETCRKANELAAIVPLLEIIPNNIFMCREDDILPMLNDCADKGQMRPAQRVLQFFENRKYVGLTARTYSVMLKGYGSQRNRVMVDSIIMSILRRGDSVRPDVVLLNSAMDAYIECNAPQQVCIY